MKGQGCRFVPYTFSETKPQTVPMDLNIGFQGLALIQGHVYNPEGEIFAMPFFWGGSLAMQRNRSLRISLPEYAEYVYIYMLAPLSYISKFWESISLAGVPPCSLEGVCILSLKKATCRGGHSGLFYESLKPPSLGRVSFFGMDIGTQFPRDTSI